MTTTITMPLSEYEAMQRNVTQLNGVINSRTILEVRKRNDEGKWEDVKYVGVDGQTIHSELQLRVKQLESKLNSVVKDSSGDVDMEANYRILKAKYDLLQREFDEYKTSNDDKITRFLSHLMRK
jgi:hypothetical protein